MRLREAVQEEHRVAASGGRGEVVGASDLVAHVVDVLDRAGGHVADSVKGLETTRGVHKLDRACRGPLTGRRLASALPSSEAPVLVSFVYVVV